MDYLNWFGTRTRELWANVYYGRIATLTREAFHATVAGADVATDSACDGNTPEMYYVYGQDRLSEKIAPTLSLVKR